jgi:hypothetical protein
MGRRRQGYKTHQKTNNNSVENVVESEGNEYLVVDHSKMISISSELNEGLKEVLKEELNKDHKEEIMEELKKKLKVNIQKQLKDYQDNTNKNLRRQRKS